MFVFLGHFSFLGVVIANLYYALNYSPPLWGSQLSFFPNNQSMLEGRCCTISLYRSKIWDTLSSVAGVVLFGSSRTPHAIGDSIWSYGEGSHEPRKISQHISFIRSATSSASSLVGKPLFMPIKAVCCGGLSYKNRYFYKIEPTKDAPYLCKTLFI